MSLIVLFVDKPVGLIDDMAALQMNQTDDGEQEADDAVVDLDEEDEESADLDEEDDE